SRSETKNRRGRKRRHVLEDRRDRALSSCRAWLKRYSVFVLSRGNTRISGARAGPCASYSGRPGRLASTENFCNSCRHSASARDSPLDFHFMAVRTIAFDGCARRTLFAWIRRAFVFFPAQIRRASATSLCGRQPEKDDREH